MASGNDTVLGTPVMNDKHFEDEIQGFEAFYRSTKTFSLLVGIGAVMLYSQQLPPQVCVGGGWRGCYRRSKHLRALIERGGGHEDSRNPFKLGYFHVVMKTNGAAFRRRQRQC